MSRLSDQSPVVSLAGRHLGADGIDSVLDRLTVRVEWFRGSVFTRVRFEWVCVRARGAHPIRVSVSFAVGMQHYAYVSDLNLSRNELGVEGANKVAAFLREDTCLKSLNLDSNLLGLEGTTAVAHSLQYNQALQHLNLDKNNVGMQGAFQLAEALKV